MVENADNQWRQAIRCRRKLEGMTAHNRAVFSTYDEKRLEELRKAAGQTKEKAYE